LSATPEVIQNREVATGGRNAPELPALTSLRGIAALVVVLFHSSYYAFHFAGGGPPWLWRRGYLAVDLFFILSGFVLAHVYGYRLTKEQSWLTIGKFLWARFCRIYPASLFTTGVFVLAFTLGKLPFPAGVSFREQLIAALLLMQVPWLGEVVINSPSWSISAECYAYLLFPFVALIIFRLTGGIAVTVSIALLTVIAVSGPQGVSGWDALGRALPEFTVGILAYRSYKERFFRKIWEKDATLIITGTVMIAAYLAGLSDGLMVVLLVPLLLASVCNSGKMAGMLKAAPLRWLGEVSYSVYIFQILPFMVAVSLAGTLVAYGLDGFRFEVIAALFAIASGVLVHRCVDVPARAVLRGLPDRLRAFAIVSRAGNIRQALLASATLPEHDR
jgi:peptidoglycan/LPS O-acetylase OafA/YrhL